jgi:lysophospholipase L1-like esterase
MPRSTFYQGLLAATIGLGCFFFFLEALLRIIGYIPEDIPFGYRGELLGDMLANKRYTAGLVTPANKGPTFSPYRIDTNAQGLRADIEITRDKPSGLRRLLCLGDSFTFGPFVDNHETYTAQMQSLLNVTRGDSIQVINAGFSGWTLPDQLSYLQEKGLALDPDLVLLQVYVNDVRELAPFFRSVLSRQTYIQQSQHPLFALQLFLRRYSSTYYLLRNIKDGIDMNHHIESLPAADENDYRSYFDEYLSHIDTLNTLLIERDIPLLIVLVPEPIPAAAWPALAATNADSLQHALAVASNAEANTLLSSNPLLPLLSAALTQRSIAHLSLSDVLARLATNATNPQDIYLLPNDHHFSRYGHHIVAQASADYIARQQLLP